MFLLTLGSYVQNILLFDEKKSYFLRISKIWYLYIKHMITTLKELILNIKIDKTL